MKYMKSYFLLLNLCYHAINYSANLVPPHRKQTYSYNLQKALYVLQQKPTVLKPSSDHLNLLKNIQSLYDMQQEIEDVVKNLPSPLTSIQKPTQKEIQLVIGLTRKACIIQALWPIYKKELEQLYKKT